MLDAPAVISNSSKTQSISTVFFALIIFLGSYLLFVIQPMTAKRLLPIFGGTPAVWTICMLFFQCSLVIAYGYAWWLSRLKNHQLWRVIHVLLCIIAFFLLPTAFPSSEINLEQPILSIIKTLLLDLGLPIIVISASAPLLQYAYSHTKFTKANDPYFLYVASNIGSFLALICFPFLMERLFESNFHFQFWSLLYQYYIVGVVVLLSVIPFYKSNSSHYQVSTNSIPWKTIGYWIILSFVPCSLMLGVTFYISTDIAATPLLWIIPLSLYLAAFTFAFLNKPLFCLKTIENVTLFLLILIISSFTFRSSQIPAWVTILIHNGTLFVLCLWCITKLAANRPDAYHLTTFYLSIAIGGVLAGLWNGIIAPNLFSYAYEYPITVFILLFFIQKKKIRILYMLMLIMSSYLLWNHFQNTLYQQRNFYGIKRVFSQNKTHYLMNQTTLHGFQIQTKSQKTNADIAYYGPITPIIKQLDRRNPSLNATILGLGTGTLLCQFQPSDKVNMIEIDSQVIQIAANTKLFSYLRDCKAKVNIIHNDGRLAFANMKDHSQNLLILDAFSSDAIPVHLLTLEAFQLYQQKLTKDGTILINASNRHIQILPVITAIAHQLNFILLYKKHAGNPALGQLASQWILLTTNESTAFNLMEKEQWSFSPVQKTLLWTDNYSNLLPLIKR